MKVFITRDIPEIGIQMLQNEGLEVEISQEEEPLNRDELISRVQDFDAVLTMGPDPIDKVFLQSCKHLKIISQLAAGYNNIDVDEATNLGIPLGYAPNAMSDATADVAFMLMLAASRKMCYMHKKIIANEWGSFRPKANLGMELKNKTLGIFGLGNIGFEMAKRCRGAYGMKVIYFNRGINTIAEKELGAKRVSFDELLEKSDVLSVHSILSSETKGTFDINAFKKMKSTAIFINTSRGQLHVEGDLIEALSQNIIWGAGLDVTNPEPMASDNPLLKMENVAITPHIGSATIEARKEMSRMAAENIIEFFRGNKIPNMINPEINAKMNT